MLWVLFVSVDCSSLVSSVNVMLLALFMSYSCNVYSGKWVYVYSLSSLCVCSQLLTLMFTIYFEDSCRNFEEKQ